MGSRLIDANGAPLWGRLPNPPSDINWRAFDWRDALGNKKPSWLKPLGFKHFDFYGVQGEGFAFGCGMVRLGLINSTFAYFFSPETGLKRLQFDLPAEAGLTLDTRPYGTTTWSHPLKPRHRVVSTRSAHARQLIFEFGEAFSGQVIIEADKADTLCLNTPIANTGFAYAQKTSGAPVSGTLVVDQRVYQINPDTAGCYHDWTAGFLRRETFWNWACVTGRQHRNAPLLSINLARGVNETSAHENVLWVDGQRFDLPLVLFDYDRDDVQKPWRVYSQGGEVNLTFTPQGSIDDHRNLIILASRFNQCFGQFSGKVTHPATGHTLEIDGLSGWCEDHYAKW